MSGPAIPMLETDRLILRAPGADDLPAYVAFYTDGAASAFYDGPMLAHRAHGRLCQDIGHWWLKGFGLWAVVRRDSGETMGVTGLAHPDGWPRHELTWWLLPGHRGQGFATEASRAAIAYGYDVLRWPAVETHMKDANRPARALAERLGGTVIRRDRFPDGEDRDIFLLPRPDAASGAAA